ncbi:thioredoxin-like fold protein [Apiospora kogelbergensis]|uniref:thioredoxin-dependent peroxiredoxin n=1 Tax=Apiospora kogelbergensis TaxID=1337665 RepID=A0AAW0R0S6_9PEZI
MSLNAQLAAVQSRFAETAPANLKDPILQTQKEIEETFDQSKAIQVGQTFPAFSLSNAVGEDVTLDGLLSRGPLLITFYRGEWCPFCNMTLASLQKHLSEFEAKGVTLVAISPELPNQSLTTTEKHALKFQVLSDVQNKLATKLGILFRQPERMRAVFKTFGHDFQTRNGDDSLEVPLPASFLIAKDGVVKKSFVSPDWTKRLETSVALEWVDEL